ncbi:MAG: M23 family metallopeptidase [Pseudomonadota bacterium]
MIADVFGDVRKRVLQTFPERQIYLRSGGEVTYYNLSTRLQLTVVGVIALMAAWSFLTLLNMALGASPFVKTDERIVALESKFESQLAESQAKIETTELMLAEQRESFEAIAADIEAKHRTLSELVEADSILSLGDEPALKFEEAEILMSPTRRDSVDRVARRTAFGPRDLSDGIVVEQSLLSLDETQNNILMSAEAELLEKIAFKRAVIEATNMDMETITGAGSEGQGGPFIPLDGPGLELIEGQFQPRTSEIEARLYEAQALAEIVEALPLGHPVLDETVMTSRFGIRRDPFTKRPTRHYGLDFIGRPMAPIVATAPGTVVKAGWNGAFGNMVEIDHGHGFTTRYAHLKKIYVKRGDTVAQGDKLGGMGSTGRSTGRHLHYEVRFQGKAYDPQTFLKAGLHVQ